ncbi:MAG: 6-phosphofructokinase [Bacillota bacterium]|jgi:6-phosphofructokinase
MPFKGNAIVAQSGGPTAVINNSVFGVVQEWLKNNTGGKIYGGISGIKGILNGDIIDLGLQDPLAIAGLRYTPGAGVHSCRYKVTPEDQEQMIDIFKALDIRYFFYIGGNDSMDTAHKTYLAAQDSGYDMCVIGIPKTVDNDLPFTDHCPGYGSAAKYLAATVQETGIDLESVSTKNKVTILEAMGRNAGWLTAAGALAKKDPQDAPHLIYLPEVAFYKERFLADVQKVYKNLGYVYVVVSEGIVDEKGEYCFASHSVDAFGHAQLSGAGDSLKQLIEKELGIKARCNTLGTAQRSAMHFASACDADEAYMVGVAAVKFALDDISGVMVTIERASQNPYKSTPGMVSLGNVANVENKIPLAWINEERNYIKPEFLDYARPLIMGEVKIPIKEGLPDYVRLDFSKGKVNL